MNIDKLRYRSHAEREWRLLYQLVRANFKGRTLETIGVFTPQQLIIRMLTIASLDILNNARQRMSAALDAHRAFRRQGEHDYFSDKFLGGVHHNFGDFKDTVMIKPSDPPRYYMDLNFIYPPNAYYEH